MPQPIASKKQTFILLGFCALLACGLVIYKKQNIGFLEKKFEPCEEGASVLFKDIFRWESTKDISLKYAFLKFRKDSGGENYIDPQIIRKMRDKRLRDRKLQQRSYIIQYDLDSDLRVTFDEIRRGIHAENTNSKSTHPGLEKSYWKHAATGQFDRIKIYDLDGDEIISHEEMLTLSAERMEGENQYIERSYAPYLSLMPEGEKRLTQRRFLKIVAKIFDDIDKDGDEKISQEEGKCLRRLKEYGYL